LTRAGTLLPRETGGVWAFAGSAAKSDALSTAFFVLRDAEIEDFCHGYPDIGAAILQEDGTVSFHGSVPAPAE
jgi:thiamine biosynthesis lipoprotein ApbE